MSGTGTSREDELVRLVVDMWNGMCPVEAEYDCAGCKHYEGGGCEYVRRIEGLGIDVDEAS